MKRLLFLILFIPQVALAATFIQVQDGDWETEANLLMRVG